MPLLLVIVLCLLAAFGGVGSLRRRLREAAPPRPSLAVRGFIVAGVTLATTALHLGSWLPLRPIVPANASAGSVLFRGPGDGLWFMLVLLGWGAMQPINVLLACYCARSTKQAALIASGLIAVWIGAAALGAALTKCPAGFVCTSG